MPFGGIRTGRGVLLGIFAAIMALAMLLRRHPNAFGWLIGSVVVLAADWRTGAVLGWAVVIAIWVML